MKGTIKIIGVEWRSSTVGIVAVGWPGGKWCACIKSVNGRNEDYDIEDVIAWGSSLNAREGCAFFPNLPASEYVVSF